MTTSAEDRSSRDTLVRGIPWAVRQLLKQVNTCLPAVVRSYNPATRRAVVEPALPMVGTDNTLLPRPPVPNVPVVFPAGGGYSLTFPLAAGDPVLLVYSQRGIGGFKRSFGLSVPDVDSFFSPRDAVAIAGFGALSITPAVSGAVTLQADDGSAYIALGPSGITLKTAGAIAIEGNGLTFNGNQVMTS